MTVTIEQHGCLFSNQSGNKRQHPSGARCFNQIIDAFARGVIMNGLDRIAIFFREDAPALGPPPAADRPEREVHERLRAALGRSALFWYDLLADTGLEAEEALPALWDLVWAGEITNDAWTPLRAGRRYQAKSRGQRPRRFSRRRVGEITATQGRWSPTARLFGGRSDRRDREVAVCPVRADEAFDLQPAQRLPQGRRAQAEDGGQLLLIHARVGREDTYEDPTAHLLVCGVGLAEMP